METPRLTCAKEIQVNNVGGQDYGIGFLGFKRCYNGLFYLERSSHHSATRCGTERTYQRKPMKKAESRALGYKTFSVLKSAENDICSAYKQLNTNNLIFFSHRAELSMNSFPVNKY